MRKNDIAFFSFMISVFIFIIGVWLVFVVGVPASTIFFGVLLFALLWVLVAVVVDILT